MEDTMENSTDLFSMDLGDISLQLFGQINWQEILRAGAFLSHRDHQLLERAQDNLSVVLDNQVDAKTLAQVLLKISDNCTSNTAVQQFVFTRVQEILGLGSDDCEGTKRASLFTGEGGKPMDATFFRALHSSDAYTKRSAAIGLACLLSTTTGGDINAFIKWLCEQLSSVTNSSSMPVLEAMLPALSMAMQCPSARTAFIAAGGIPHLATVLSSLGASGNAQILYECCFCVWTLSLSMENSEEDLARFLSAGMVRLLADLVNAAPSRKIVRMAVASFRNLSSTQDPEVLTEMLNVGLERQLEIIINNGAHKQAGDPEMEGDIKAVRDILLRNYRDLSTFDRWTSEIQTGSLRWGIVHTERFWRENAKLLETNDFKWIKDLILFLHSDNPTTVCIAMYDLGEFTRFYPNGRGISKSLGGKDIVLGLIDHANPEIQKHALQCISKVMITNWDHLK